MPWGNLTDIPKNTLSNPLGGVTIILLFASGIFFEISKGEVWPHPSIIGSFFTFGMAVVSVLLCLAFAISDSRVDRIIKLKDDDIKQVKTEYLGIISTLEGLVNSSVKRDHAYNEMQTRSYENTSSGETSFGGLTSVLDETTKG